VISLTFDPFLPLLLSQALRYGFLQTDEDWTESVLQSRREKLVTTGACILLAVQRQLDLKVANGEGRVT